MGLSERDRFRGEHGFETFLNRLLGVKSDRFVIAIGNFGQLPARLDVAIGEGQIPEREVTRLLRARLCLLSAPSTGYGRVNGSTRAAQLQMRR